MLKDFVEDHNIKHAIRELQILKVAKLHAAVPWVSVGPLVFVDTDTYFKRSPALLFDRIGNGKTLFHTKEARLFEQATLRMIS